MASAPYNERRKDPEAMETVTDAPEIIDTALAHPPSSNTEC